MLHRQKSGLHEAKLSHCVVGHRLYEYAEHWRLTVIRLSMLPRILEVMNIPDEGQCGLIPRSMLTDVGEEDPKVIIRLQRNP